MNRSGLRKFVGYAGVGATGTAVQYAVVAVVLAAHATGAVTASCLGAVAGAIVNYGLNYRFTFRATGPHRRSAPRFAVVACAGIALNGVLMATLTRLAKLPWLPAQIVTTGCVLLLTYTASSLWTFRTRRT